MMELLKKLCSIQSPSGNESKISLFLIDYIKKNKKKWKKSPKVFTGLNFQDTIVLVFGKPKTAIFSHIDSIGFTVGYNNEILRIGGPKIKDNYALEGEDSFGKIKTKLQIKKKKNGEELFIKHRRKLERGTTLTFTPNFRENKNYIQCCYLDNRLGVWNALQVAKTLENGIICFSTYEEHGGGSVGFLGKFIYKKYNIKQALISDITWVTKGINHGKGVAISMRDSGIPRKSYLDKIIYLAKESKIPFQLEVESLGGSDGNQLQKSPYPIDWCFIGAAEKHVHSPDEKVHKKDIDAMVKMYKYLMKKL